MINSANALEFLKPKLLAMDKYNSTTTTKLLPPSSLTQTSTFSTIGDSFQEKKTTFLLNDETKHQDRVRVQHVENHTKLQNNKCWNDFNIFYNIKGSSSVGDGEDTFQLCQIKDDNEIDVVNVEHLPLTTTSRDNQKKSALNLDLNKYNNNNRIGGNNVYDNYIDNAKDSAKIKETNNNYNFYCNKFNNYGLITKPATKTIVMSTEPQLRPTTDFHNNWRLDRRRSESPMTNNYQSIESCINRKPFSQVVSFSNSGSVTKTIESQRTEDQNNAYRHIESVHNYAKSKSFEGDDDDKTSPNGSRHSSYLDDEEDDEEDNDDDDREYDNDDDIDYEDRLHDDLDADYEDIFSKRGYRRFQKLSTSDGALLNNSNKIFSRRAALELKKTANLKDHQLSNVKLNNKTHSSCEDDEAQIDVDVETVESQLVPTTSAMDTNSIMENNDICDDSTVSIKPAHHARRPMNAFLIFCKRHRAIVKERYKNLENRAITKILGDWWASLDTSDKKCFTNLAQQNKDAFFSANPNFKWYKLPAPPLRTLTTRPANTFGQEYQDDNVRNSLEVINNLTRFSNQSNYFKLADEAQMGDLSQLMQDKSENTNQCADLQQVLGETSEFMSEHITGSSDALGTNHLKRRLYNENSVSSNSSEDDIEPQKKKSVRSCKGKIYQELINSGQIATAVKKSKPSTRPVCGDGGINLEINVKQNFADVNRLSNVCQNRSLSESENMSYDLNGFDLEERIKELPALNLDDYLQRKRNTKKKKKFSSNGKKKGQRNNNNNSSSNNIASENLEDNTTEQVSQKAQSDILCNERLQQHQLARQHQQYTAVGSQKRKARKESITRRDVSAIEQEVASLLPLTINGCCYFQEAPNSIKYKKTIEKDTEVSPTTLQQMNVTSVETIIPFTQQNTSSSVSIEMLNSTNLCNNVILNDNISSSTSDLLILAEVAANRTELKH